MEKQVLIILPAYNEEASLAGVIRDIKASPLYENSDVLIINDGSTDATARIALRDIACIEAFAHSVTITTRAAAYDVRASIGEIEKKLGKAFARCHRSYIVGLAHVSRITKVEVILDGGRAVPLSRRLYTAVNLAFIEYHKGGA